MTMKRLLIACLCALTATALAQDLAFTNVKVFDGESMLEGEQTVLVQDGWIAAVGIDIEIPEGTETIDGAGATLMPGLIDSHVHTFYEQALQQNAVFGVTTVLDMFTDEGLATSMRQAQQDGGVTDRADMFSSGMLATAPGGHGTQFGVQVDTLTEAAEAEHWVDARIAAGADYIKVILETGEEMDFQVDTISDEILRAVIDASHVRGLIVVAHVQTLEAAKQAVAAGVDGLAHIFTDAVADEEFVAAAVDSGLFVIPTLTVFQSVGSEPIDESISGDPLLAPYLSSQDLQNLGMPFSGFEQLSLENGLESVRLLHEAGVPILAGTDAMNPGTAYGASMHREVVLLGMAGLSPAEALASATSVPARTFELDNRGVVREQNRADLLLVNGDPTEDILATRDIRGVWKGGVAIDREAWAQANEALAAGTGEQPEALSQGGPVVVSDFESGDLSVSFGHPWEPTTDMPAGGDSTVEVAVVETDSGHALEVTGTVGEAFAFPWSGVMFMPASMPFGPADLSAAQTLAFDAAGDPGTYRLQMYCANLGQQAIVQWEFDITEDWESFDVDLATVGGCDPSGVMALIFSAGTPGPFSFMLDNVTLQ